jgi:hypothetical protein
MPRSGAAVGRVICLPTVPVQDHSEGFCTMINRVVPHDPVKLARSMP